MSDPDGSPAATPIALAADTTFTQVADNIYERHIDDTWLGFPGLFGGYVNALAVQACALAVADPTRKLRSLTVHFLRRFPVGPMRIETQIERQGASVSVVTARIFCDGRLNGLATLTFGKDRPADDFCDLTMPTLPPAGDFDPTQPLSPDLPFEFRKNLRMWDVFDGSVGQASNGTTLRRSGGWALPAQDDQIDERFLVAIADGFTPVVFRRHGGSMMAGTMEFTAYVRADCSAVPPGEPVLAELTTAASLSGYVEEDCNIWSRGGALLLQSRQMRFIQKTEGEGIQMSG